MNSTYLVTYDLLKPGQHYDSLLTRLRELGAQRTLASTWLLRSRASSVDICNDLARFMDNNDRLLVTGLTGEAAWRNPLIDPRPALAA